MRPLAEDLLSCLSPTFPLKEEPGTFYYTSLSQEIQYLYTAHLLFLFIYFTLYTQFIKHLGISLPYIFTRIYDANLSVRGSSEPQPRTPDRAFIVQISQRCMEFSTQLRIEDIPAKHPYGGPKIALTYIVNNKKYMILSLIILSYDIIIWYNCTSYCII
jgi:hypothetical protein